MDFPAFGHEETNDDIMQRVFAQAGWQRHLPESAAVLMFVLVDGTANRRVIAQRVERMIGRPAVRLHLPAWSVLEPWTDEELREADAGRPPGFVVQTAEEVNREERERRATRMARVDRYSATFGVRPVRTYDHLLDLMCACTLVLEEDRGEVVYRINPGALLPTEILPLTDEERDDEDALRWRTLHTKNCARLTELFDPDGDRQLDSRSASLRTFAGYLDIDIESARQALAMLLGEPEFVSEQDAERVGPDELITITVDWVQFDAARA